MLRRQLLVGASFVPLLQVLPGESLAQIVQRPEGGGLPEHDEELRVPPAVRTRHGGQIETLGADVHGSLESGIVHVAHVSTTPGSTELQQALRLINNERTKRGVAPLALDSRLRCAAQGHARYMSTARVCGHTGSGGSTFIQRIEACGYKPWRYLGENVACGYSTWSAAMKVWMSSSGHRANILSPRFGNVGLGRYNHSYVQSFGAR